MARQPRQDEPDTLHHVVFVGVNRTLIFVDDHDREGFLARAKRVFSETGTRCLSWSLIPDHAHLHVWRRSTSLSLVMQRLLGGYAAAFNKRHGRTGHLFKERFYSEPANGPDHVWETLRYVLLNPVKHGVIPNLAALRRWRWSSLPELLGHRVSHLCSAEVVLRNLGGTSREGRQGLIALLEGPHASRGASFQLFDGCRRVSEVPPARPGPTAPETVLARACEALGVYETALRMGSKRERVSEARTVTAFVLVRVLGYQNIDAVRLLAVAPSSVTKALRRGDKLIQTDSRFAELVMWSAKGMAGS